MTYACFLYNFTQNVPEIEILIIDTNYLKQFDFKEFSGNLKMEIFQPKILIRKFSIFQGEIQCSERKTLLQVDKTPILICVLRFL